jgi:uncharacterized protein (UPF0264 family)
MMQLLVSVGSAAEASAALAGGADVIDAKDPLAGPLGPVPIHVLRDIQAAVAGAQPVSAALGDATDEVVIERDARAFVAAGAQFVKVGFGGISSAARVATLTAAAVQGARAARRVTAPVDDLDDSRLRPDNHRRPVDHSPVARLTQDTNVAGVVAVVYADMASPADPALLAFVPIAARAGAVGVLLDTANKRAPGLRALVPPPMLAAWIAKAHDAGLVVALAGKLTADDLVFVRDAGADIAGVRGAACDGGRTGRVTADRVRLLRDRFQLR